VFVTDRTQDDLPISEPEDSLTRAVLNFPLAVFEEAFACSKRVSNVEDDAQHSGKLTSASKAGVQQQCTYEHR